MQDPIYSKIENTPRPSVYAANGLVWLAAAGLWLSELAAILLGGLIPLNMAAENALYYLPFVVLPIALYMRRRPGLGEAMRLNPPPLVPLVSVALLAILSVFAASVFTSAWGLALDALRLPRAATPSLPEGESALVLSILVQAAMPAVCEELLFRGFALAAWERLGTRFAVAVTTLLFALLHGNLYGLPAYLLVGAIAGFVAFALDSVYAAMVYHTVYNAACLIIPWLVSPNGEAARDAAGAAPGFTLALQTVTLLALMAALLASLRVHAHLKRIEPIPRVRRPLEARDKWTLAGATATMAATMVAILALSSMTGGAA